MYTHASVLYYQHTMRGVVHIRLYSVGANVLYYQHTMHIRLYSVGANVLYYQYTIHIQLYSVGANHKSWLQRRGQSQEPVVEEPYCFCHSAADDYALLPPGAAASFRFSPRTVGMCNRLL